MMRALRSDTTKISFEGYLAQTDLTKLTGASFDETPVLKRGTLSPRLDFITLPLDETSCSSIEQAIISKIPFKNGRGIIRVQIERDGELAFAAFDSFQHCTVRTRAVHQDFLDELRERHILHPAAFAP
jgi:hypothetical protein